MKRICVLLLAVALLLITFSSVVSAEGTEVLRGFKGGYQYVYFGQYPYEEDGTVRSSGGSSAWKTATPCC